jgi:hypothetical protein
MFDDTSTILFVLPGLKSPAAPQRIREAQPPLKISTGENFTNAD